MAATDGRTGAKRGYQEGIARLGLKRVGGRPGRVQAAAVTADAFPSIRGPCAGLRRSGWGSSPRRLYPYLSAPARGSAQSLDYGHQHDDCQAQGKGEAGRDMAATDARTGAKRVCHERLPGWA